MPPAAVYSIYVFIKVTKPANVICSGAVKMKIQGRSVVLFASFCDAFFRDWLAQPALLARSPLPATTWTPCPAKKAARASAARVVKEGAKVIKVSVRLIAEIILNLYMDADGIESAKRKIHIQGRHAYAKHLVMNFNELCCMDGPLLLSYNSRP